MLHVVDDLIPDRDLLSDLRQLCDDHGRLKRHADGSSLFSWLPTQGSAPGCSPHDADNQAVFGRYLRRHLLPRIKGFCPAHAGLEWWCNTNNDLDWHIDKNEALYRRSGRYELPLLSTVVYPHVSCAGGELLIADNRPVPSGHVAGADEPPLFRSVISIPPVVNRLVLFSPGILHRINPFRGERYSLAVNIWGAALRA
jgi:hypothetical protein